jgi:peptide/nickel transport system permease protein
LVRNRLALVGLLIVGTLVVVGVGAPWLAPLDPNKQFDQGLDEAGMPRPPGGTFALGTDSLGRDILSRLIYGARISLLVGAVAMTTAMLIGVLVGLFAGYYGGRVDFVLMRLTDIVMTIPTLLLAIALVAVLERNVWNVFLVVGAVTWTGIARVVRGQVLALREREFVLAARAIGCSHARIIWRHILPNVLPLIVVLASLRTAYTLLLDAGLSYLGIGVPPPTPSWGVMIKDGLLYYLAAPWMIVPPALAVIVAVIGFNLLGQGLQDVLDPYQKS